MQTTSMTRTPLRLAAAVGAAAALFGAGVYAFTALGEDRTPSASIEPTTDAVGEDDEADAAEAPANGRTSFAAAVGIAVRDEFFLDVVDADGNVIATHDSIAPIATAAHVFEGDDLVAVVVTSQPADAHVDAGYAAIWGIHSRNGKLELGDSGSLGHFPDASFEVSFNEFGDMVEVWITDADGVDHRHRFFSNIGPDTFELVAEDEVVLENPDT